MGEAHQLFDEKHVQLTASTFLAILARIRRFVLVASKEAPIDRQARDLSWLRRAKVR